jgi:multidrug transporter EmrE-like cation transporter
MYLAVNIVVFFIMQVVAALLFKWGSTAPNLYWWGFGLGNLFGATSIIMLINVYKVLNPNLTLAICTGGTFLLNQVALSIVFKSPIGVLPAVGSLLIVMGIVLIAAFK